MLDPTIAASKRDYRSFGNMLFERKTDPLEINNLVNLPTSIPVVKQLTDYYSNFEKITSNEGRQEMIEAAKSGTKAKRIKDVLKPSL